MRNRPVLHGRFWILTHSSRLWKICAQAGPQKLARQNVGLAFAPNCGLLSGLKGTFVRFGRYRLISRASFTSVVAEVHGVNWRQVRRTYRLSGCGPQTESTPA
jgi:hypothetical protein